MSDNLPMIQDDGGGLSVERLLQSAVANNASVEALERLTALFERVQAEKARREYNEAIAAFQADCPEVPKLTPVPDKSGRTKYRYARIEAVAAHIRPYLQQHGLSYRFDTEETERGVKATCIVTHAGGHSERVSVSLRRMSIIHATDSQNDGGTMTMACRRALLNAFGIATADTDTDGVDPEPPDDTKVSREQSADLQAMLAEIPAEKRDMGKFWTHISGRAGVEVARMDDVPARLYSYVVQMLDAKRRAGR